MIELCRHPTSLEPAIQSVRAGLEWGDDGRLAVRFEVRGETDELQIPKRLNPRFQDGLWEHTCFELFATHQGHSGYQEFNLAPSGRWAGYGFTAYREGMTALPIIDPEIRVSESDGELVLNAALSIQHSSDLSFGLSAVIENVSGRRSYWALAHFGDKPDFHDHRSFTHGL